MAQADIQNISDRDKGEDGKNCIKKRHTKSVQQKVKGVQEKFVRSLLHLVILQFLNANSMYGYQIITSIRRDFGVHFGSSTIYPLLTSLEKEGYIKGQWDLTSDRPRKIYNLSYEGQSLLRGTEESLNQICCRLDFLGLKR